MPPRRIEASTAPPLNGQIGMTERMGMTKDSARGDRLNVQYGRRGHDF